MVLPVLFWWTVVSVVTGPTVGRFLRRFQPPSSPHWVIDAHRTRNNLESLRTRPNHATQDHIFAA
jgi:hypothetical protein